MKRLTCAYAAGIIDGEGTIALTHNSDCKEFRFPSVHVPSTDLELLEFFKDVFGGTIIKKKVYKKHHRPSYTWYVTHNRAISFLRMVRPYLRINEKINRAQLIQIYP